MFFSIFFGFELDFSHNSSYVTRVQFYYYSNTKGGKMGFKTKVQLINRKASQQWYINFPSACAQMMDFKKGEEVEWILTEDGNLMLKRDQNQRSEDGGTQRENC
jgi:hypothetical protein